MMMTQTIASRLTPKKEMKLFSSMPLDQMSVNIQLSSQSLISQSIKLQILYPNLKVIQELRTISKETNQPNLRSKSMMLKLCTRLSTKVI